MQKQIKAYSEFGYYVHRIATISDKKGDKLFRDELGISLRQFLLLRLIEAGERTVPSQQAIADRLGIAKSAVSRHIDIASKSGWLTVKTAENSRRQHMVTLTKTGRQLLKKAEKLVQKSEQAGFGDVAGTDIEATLRVLKSILEKLGRT